MKATYHIPKMDCPSEERLIRMALEPQSNVRGLEVDLSTRRVHVWHEGSTEEISSLIFGLGLGGALETVDTTSEAPDTGNEVAAQRSEARTLKIVLAINAAMFVLELGAGLVARSVGLIADSLDMFADAAVYGISLYAVGKAAFAQRRSARLSGWLQVTLALAALFEVVRRFLEGGAPEPTYIMAFAFLALIANIVCLALVRRQSGRGVHMDASVIFSTNDVIANMGVLLAGFLVRMTGSPLPDLIIGLLIAVVVLRGGVRIIKVSKA